MPICSTKYFDTVEHTEESVIRFPLGLPGFEDERDFVFIEQPHQRPLLFLQSLNTPALCFIVAPVAAVDPDYELRMRAEDLEVIGFEAPRQPRIGTEVFCGVILTAAAEGEQPTANLLAPLVMHLQTRTAVQAIQAEPAYSHCHRLRTAEMELAC